MDTQERAEQPVQVASELMRGLGDASHDKGSASKI